MIDIYIFFESKKTNRSSGEEVNRPFLVSTLTQDGRRVVTHNGLRVEPDYNFEKAPCFDIVVVPGGPFSCIQRILLNEEVSTYVSESKGCPQSKGCG